MIKREIEPYPFRALPTHLVLDLKCVIQSKIKRRDSTAPVKQQKMVSRGKSSSLFRVFRGQNFFMFCSLFVLTQYCTDCTFSIRTTPKEFTHASKDC